MTSFWLNFLPPGIYAHCWRDALTTASLAFASVFMQVSWSMPRKYWHKNTASCYNKKHCQLDLLLEGENKVKKSLLIVFVCVLSLSLLLTACGGGGGGGGGGGNTGGGVSDGGGGSGRGGGGPATTVTLKNTYDFEICQAFISPVNKNVWGSNMFAEGEKVAPGASLTLGRIASGNYDLKVVNCDGTKEGKIPFTMP